MLAALKAGSKTVDLRQLASHYYELAARVLELFEEEEIVDLLSEVCTVAVRSTRMAAPKGRDGSGMRMGRLLGADLRCGNTDVQGKSSGDCRSCS